MAELQVLICYIKHTIGFCATGNITKIMGLWGNKYIYVLKQLGKYYTPHPPLLLLLYEGFALVRKNITYIYDGNYRQRVKSLNPPFKSIRSIIAPKYSMTELS